jgi:hypothetical protein
MAQTTQKISSSPAPRHFLALINQLQLKAYLAESVASLSFIIVNDTIILAPFKRAVLWRCSSKRPKVLSISGQAAVTQKSALAKEWKKLVKKLKNPKIASALKAEDFIDAKKDWENYQKNHQQAEVLWVPIYSDKHQTIGLWIERWNAEPWNDEEQNKFKLLAQGYSAAWKTLAHRFTLSSVLKKKTPYAFVALLAFLLVVHVPLRIVAPCEVVPRDPILVTAPLNGIISEIHVEPSQYVKKGELLFEYDKRIPLQQLKVAEKQVEIIESEIHRSMTKGYGDKQSLNELSVLSLKLEKEKIQLDLARYHASKLDALSPVDGIVLIDNPEDWRGKPVQAGERVLVVSDPDKTKIRAWVPIDDNIRIDKEQPMKIILNVDPATTLEANLLFIANNSIISDKDVPAFEAEAKWISDPENMRMGLKGSAVLYGDKVSLFYYLFRKPWASIRGFFGI